MTDDIISTINYKESNPIYRKIKNKFTQKLKDKYQCEDYDKIVDYVFQYVFKNKLKKIECISKMEKIFNNKTEYMMNYLWKITKDAENLQGESDSESDDNDTNKYYKRKRDRSRSYDRKEPKNKFDLDNYNNYPPRMIPKGFYPPKGRYGGSIMPLGGVYPPYMVTPPIKKR